LILATAADLQKSRCCPKGHPLGRRLEIRRQAAHNISLRLLRILLDARRREATNALRSDDTGSAPAHQDIVSVSPNVHPLLVHT
jgi:hypothetical protein